MAPGSDTRATDCQAPPASGRRSRVPVCPHPPLGGAGAGDRQDLAVDHLERLDRAARGEPPVTTARRRRSSPTGRCRTRTRPTGSRTGFPTRPARPAPTAPPAAPPARAARASSRPGSACAGSTCTAPSRTGRCQGRTPPEAETNVTEVAANPIGTGPPDGTVTVDVAAGVVGVAGAGRGRAAASRRGGGTRAARCGGPRSTTRPARRARRRRRPPRARRSAGGQRHRGQQGAGRQPDP